MGTIVCKVLGFNVSEVMQQNIEKNQEFMLEMQKIQMERQIQMQNQMRERMMAMQLARSREFFYWFLAFYGVCTTGMLLGYRTTRQKRVLLPLVPLTFILSYQADLCYGNKLKRIQVEAELIMEFEHDSLEMPFGVPSLSSIDQARMRQSDERRLKKVHDIYF